MSDSKRYVEFLDGLKRDFKNSLGYRIEKLAIEKPNDIALIYQDSQVTYEQLNQLSNRYAWYFSSTGYNRGDVIALLMDNSIDYIAIIIGLSKLGVITSLINTELRSESLAEDINLCDARAIISSDKYMGIIYDAKYFIRLRAPGDIYIHNEEDIKKFDGIKVLNDLLPTKKENPDLTKDINSFESLVYIYTSGSGGHRKAIPITHQKWLMLGKATEVFTAINENSIQYLCLPLHLNTGFNACFSSMIATGSTMVIKSGFSVTNFWNDIRKYKADYCVGVGEMFRYLYNQQPLPDDKNHSLKAMISNGMNKDLVQPFKERFGVDSIVEIYGTTENVGIFINTEEVPGMCGNLNLAGIRQGELVKYDIINDKIVTDDEGKAIKCSIGEVGLLLGEINELNNFEGYINDPNESESRILNNVFVPGDKYFNTGDLMQLHENDYISFVRRMGDIYRWKGRTISAHRVADVIKKFFGAIDDAYVFGKSLPGFEGRCGMAVITLLEGEKLNWKEFNDYIKRKLPPHERPVFIRISKEVNLNKELKKKYQKEGANPQLVPEQLYYYDIKLEEYSALNLETYENILAHKVII
ncbi:hypothetical protein SYNTR_0046 [Candidatus Syntrophocurvum alkaliphilum]|uniref:AMP-dependent synthetase/ligase domain-containing protein n=1 Tax=Candidatus Syntrophocurvum alkaliphilum TaxID=2293317 RepID=A0A6I6DG07_9FIRM|nr:AMP-binding protein [Candidatus Syntrophocurvum alkaliphilum]QGT98639.1 hypothetical protein SYNTR_0046 [Candidatus Syntrophocurvum alkaliphilum]